MRANLRSPRRWTPLVLTLAALACPAVAQGQAQPAAPVAILDCRGGIASVELVEIAAYDVTIRNTAGVAADEVRMSMRYGRRRKNVAFDVRGTFSPQVDVKRALRKSVGMGLFSNESSTNDCTVDFVHFADGTSWTAPARAR